MVGSRNPSASGERLAGFDEKLHQLDLEHDVPTESDLGAARDLREESWRLVRAVLCGDPAPEESAKFVAQFRAETLEGARAAGMRAVLIDRTGAAGENPGVERIASLADLPGMLGRLDS